MEELFFSTSYGDVFEDKIETTGAGLCYGF